MEIRELYNIYIKKLNDEVRNEDSEKIINDSLENIREIWLKKKKDVLVERKVLLLTWLYIWIPALRSDYYNSKIEDNKIIINNKVKVDKDSSYSVDIPEELQDLVEYYDTIPKIKNSFCTILSRASNKLFNKSYSVNMYRHLWVDYQKRTNNDLDARISLAEQMNHSLNTSKYIYERKNI